MRLASLALLVGCLSAQAAAPFVSDSLPERAKQRIGTARLRHGGLVRWLAFSPDGKRLASASHDQTVSIWEVPSGRELYRLRGHEADVLAVSFSRDGQMLASAGADGFVCLWAASGSQAGQFLSRFRLRGPTTESSVEALAFSPTSDVLAAGGDTGIIELYDVRKRSHLGRLNLDGDLRCLAWSADGKRLATNGVDWGITIWDAEKGISLHRLGKEKVNCLSFAPDGSKLLSWEAGGIVRLWDAVRLGQLRRFSSRETSALDPGLTYQIAFSHDGKKAFVGSMDGPIDVWETATGKHLALLTGHHGRVTALALSPRGDLLASGGADHTIRLWNVQTQKEHLPALAGGGGRNVPFATGPDSPIALALPLPGKDLAVLLDTGHLNRYDRRTGRPVAESPTRNVCAAAILPGGADMVVVDASSLGRWRTEKNLWQVLDKGDPLPVKLSVSADGKRMVTTHRDGSLWLRDGTGKRLTPCRGREGRITPLLSPDGAIVVGFGHTAAILQWNGQSGHQLPSFPGHRGGTLAAAFSSDGKHLVSGGRDNLLRIWDVKTRREVRMPSAHDAWVCAVAFSPNSKLLASATVRGDIHLFSAKTGRLVGELLGHRGAVRSLAFADSGETLISAGQDTSVLLWNVAGITDDRPLPLRLSAARAEELWQDLRDSREPIAVLALQKLARAAERAVPLVRAHVRPVDGARIARLIQQLDDESYQTRIRAFNDLASQGRFAEGQIQAALRRKPNLEARRRLEELLRRSVEGEAAAVHRQALRAVELLEMIASAESRKVLERLASGAAEAELTQNAKAAIERLKK